MSNASNAVTRVTGALLALLARYSRVTRCDYGLDKNSIAGIIFNTRNVWEVGGLGRLGRTKVVFTKQ